MARFETLMVSDLELRDAVLRFRAHKPAIAFAECFGEVRTAIAIHFIYLSIYLFVYLSIYLLL